MSHIWNNKTVYIKGFWGWSPESWAAIGFNGDYRETLIAKTTDPFIMVIYVVGNKKSTPDGLKGKIVGFYEVSHQRGHRNEFTAEVHHPLHPEKWQNAIRAIRAFEFHPDFRLNIYDFAPSFKLKSQYTAAYGALLTDEQIEELKRLPYREVNLFNPQNALLEDSYDNSITLSGKVRGGPVNRSGYFVYGEPLDTVKELYALKLNGGSEVFLDEKLSGHGIYKIGLSNNPKSRLEFFKSTLPFTEPRNKIAWLLHRCTRADSHDPYPNFESALKGEDAMKNYLNMHGKWLGGEFYAATEAVFEQAWNVGRTSALDYKV